MNIVQNAQSAPHLPTSHVQSLSAIEDGYWWFQGRVFWAEQMIREVWKANEKPNAVDYVDIGCGTGGFAGRLMTQLKTGRVALLDGDPKALKLAERITGATQHLVDLNQDFQLPWTPNLVTCMDVIEHIEYDGAFLSKVQKQMAPQALIVISVPALPVLYSEWDKQLGHFRRYTARTLKAVIAEAGLELISLKFMWSFLFPAAPIRKLKARRYARNMEFESVPELTNSILVWLSRMEWALTRYVPAPFGTSLIAIAGKK